ncbi:MAG: response regulator transcription factor [Verrucomicrobiota bacterium]
MNPSATTSIRLLVADDHFLFRTGVVNAVEMEDDIEVVAEAAGGNEAVEQFKKHRPGLTLMDLRMEHGDGFEAIKAVHAIDKNAAIIALTTYDGSEDIQRALQAGARGYLTKEATTEELVGAIRKVSEGGFYVPTAIRTRLAAREGRESLSQREHEILTLIVRGRSNKEIASDLGIAETTVKVHVSNVLRKLGVLDRTQAAILAVREGMVAVP